MITRVLIVDDSAFMRKALSSLLGADAGIQVIDTARNGQEGLEKIQKLRPDVVTMDIEMPVMDGLTALSKVRLLPDPRPAVLMCSTLTVAGSREALKALRLGAADVIAKDPDAIGAGNEQIRRDLIARVKAVSPAAKRAALSATSPAAAAQRGAPVRSVSLAGKAVDLVVIGSSTGGPPILEQVLGALPKALPVPVVIAQHMPALFTKSMAERLGEICAVPVVHAEHDQLMQAGTAYLIVGGKHGRVQRMGAASGGRWRLEVNGKPETALYKPSVNELFLSAAQAGERAVGVMLTGMGDDGCVGARSMHAAGATILTQLGETCAVYGMPKAVVEAGVSHAALTPQQLGECLAALGGGQSRGAGPAIKVA